MPGRLKFSRLSVREQPALLLALAFASGVTASRPIHVSVAVACLMLVTAWFLSLVLICRSRSTIAITSIVVSFFIGGLASGTQIKAYDAQRPIKKLLNGLGNSERTPLQLTGRLTSNPELAPDRIYLSLDTERIGDSAVEQFVESSIRLVIYFNGNSDREAYDRLDLKYSDRVQVRAELRSETPFRNPGSPDFSQILTFKGFDATGVIAAPSDIRKIQPRAYGGLTAHLYRARSRSIRLLLEGTAQPASGILAASLFGNRYFIDQRPARAFREGGTFHLIVISGMHITLIASALLWLTKRVVTRQLVRYPIIVFVIWCYTIIAGAEPAVTRAAIMATLAVLAMSIHRPSRGPNALATAALFLLIWQPRDIFNPSFQLSFLTVAVITMIASPLYLRMREIGSWLPSERTPHPPRASQALRSLSETLFWDGRAFTKRRGKGRVKFKLDKFDLSRKFPLSGVQTLLRGIFATLLVTTSVQIVLLPLMITYFNRVSLISPLANIVDGMLLTLLMGLACAYLVVALISSTIAYPMARVLNFVGPLIGHTDYFVWRSFPGSLRIPALKGGLALTYIAYFVFLIALTLRLNRWSPFAIRSRQENYKLLIRTVQTALFITLLFIIVNPPDVQKATGRLAVTFLDVGQGDSSLVRFPQGTAMLIDAGGRLAFLSRRMESETAFIEDIPGIGELAVAPALWFYGLKRLDYIVATHGDSDHVQGFQDITESFAIGEALAASSRNHPDPFPREVATARIPRRLLESGQSLIIDGTVVDVISPLAEFEGEKISENNRSVVLRITFRNRSFLMTGDIERKTEDRLSAALKVAHSDVLKVAHHGSKSSSTDRFLSKVLPCFAIVSAGRDNHFGHPHRETIERLRRTGAEILHTGNCGAITISTDGDDLTCETLVPCRRSY